MKDPVQTKNYSHIFKKEFGQNFLKSIPDIIELVETINPDENDYVLEIGPGDGKVTEMLVQTVGQVSAIEIDKELSDYLQASFGEVQNLKIIHHDILTLDIDAYLEKNKIKEYKVVGSLPYNISKKIIKQFAGLENKPSVISVIMQKEVAQDYAANAPKSSFLNQLYSCIFDIEYIKTVRKDFFYPEPKVHGGIVKFTLKNKPLVPYKEFEKYAKFLKNCYLSPRKKLIKVLKNVYKEIDWMKIYENLKFEENWRPAELDPEQLIQLWEKSVNSVK